MNDSESTRVPVDDADGRQVEMAPGGFREVRPGYCWNCDAAAPAGARFCTTCQHFLPTPHVGRLAPAKRRLAAVALDEVVKDGGLLGSLFWPNVLPSGPGATIVAVLSTVYVLSMLFLWTRGTTPAKRLLQMTVVTEDGEPATFFRMLFRETIGKMISVMALGLGFLSVPLDREKQGWHDKIFGTWVVIDDDD